MHEGEVVPLWLFARNHVKLKKFKTWGCHCYWKSNLRRNHRRKREGNQISQTNLLGLITHEWRKTILLSKAEERKILKPWKHQPWFASFYFHNGFLVCKCASCFWCQRTGLSTWSGKAWIRKYVTPNRYQMYNGIKLVRGHLWSNTCTHEHSSFF